MLSTPPLGPRRPVRKSTGRRPPMPAQPGVLHLSPFDPQAEEPAPTPSGLLAALRGALGALGGACVVPEAQPPAHPSPWARHVTTERVADARLQQAEPFASQALWPALHSFAAHLRFEPRDWEAFVRFNDAFAQAAARAWDRAPADHRPVVWVHDHRLMLVPGLLRRARPQAAIGFFVHSPFPAPDVWQVLPPHQTLLDSLLDADLLGFQSARHRDLLLEAAGHARTRRAARAPTCAVSPVGVDVDAMAALASQPRVRAEVQRVRGAFGPVRLVLCAHRLDATKGLREQVRGFAELLERHPEHRGRVSLLLASAVAPAHDAPALERELDEAVARLNGRFEDGRWTPVHFVTRPLTREELAASFALADVALAAPLREGQNLVAKEYVTARLDGGGSLVLGTLSGTADELPQAISCHPYDPSSIADALHRALTEPEADRARRMRTLRRQVLAQDVHRWARDFARRLAQSAAPRTQPLRAPDSR